MNLRRLCLLTLQLLWLALLGLLTVANTIACASIGGYPLFPVEWTLWLLPRARHAHDRCQACCKEVIRL